MTAQSQRYRTQWAAQFFAAAELTRRGYLVALTMGNAKEADLLVVSPRGKSFRVDVKGQKDTNFWLVQRRDVQEELYFILVLVSLDVTKQPQYFIMSCEDMVNEMDNLKRSYLDQGKAWSDKGEGINWGQSLPYSEKWDRLPE